MQKRLTTLILALIFALTLTTSVFAATPKPTAKSMSLESAANTFNAYLSKNFPTKNVGTRADDKPLVYKVLAKKIFILNNYPVMIFEYGASNPSNDADEYAAIYFCNIQSGKTVNLLKKEYGHMLEAAIDTKYDKVKSTLVLHASRCESQIDSTTLLDEDYYNFINNKLSTICSQKYAYVSGDDSNPNNWNYTINGEKVTKASYDSTTARYTAVPANAKGQDVYQTYLNNYFGYFEGEQWAILADLDGDGKSELVAEKNTATFDKSGNATFTIFNVKYPNSSNSLNWVEPADNTDGTYFYISDKNYIVSESNDGNGNNYVVYKYSSGKLNKIASYVYKSLYNPKTYSRNGKPITKTQWDSDSNTYGLDKQKTNFDNSDNAKGEIFYHMIVELIY